MRETEVHNRVEEALRSCLGDVPFLTVESVESQPARDDGRSPDFVLSVGGTDGSSRLVVEAKANGQPRFARSAAQQLRSYVEQGEYGVFVAPYISERAASILSDAGVGFVDLAGNCRLCFDGVYVRREGNENPFSETRTLKSLFAPKASRVLRPLLRWPARAWKTQELSEEVGVSLGHVSNVRTILLNEEWAEETSRGVRLTDPESLLQTWAEGYDPEKNKYHLFYSFDDHSGIEEKLGRVGADRNVRYALTAFSGAERVAPHVRYERASAFVESGRIDEVANLLSLKRVESGPTIELIEPYDEGVFYGRSEEGGMCVAHPVQLYLDLWSRPGRGKEAVDFLLRKMLRPSWSTSENTS